MLKPVPLHAARRLGERRYSSYSFSTSALDAVGGQRHAQINDVAIMKVRMFFSSVQLNS
jgi:hypothetical protein